MCALISWLELLLFVYLSNTQIVFCIYLSVISHLLFFDLVYLLDAKDLFQSKFHSRLIPTLYCVCVLKIDIVEFFFFFFFFFWFLELRKCKRKIKAWMENNARSKFNRICVFCGSNQGHRKVFSDAAIELGNELVGLLLVRQYNQFFLWYVISFI